MRSWENIWQIDASASWAIILDDDFYIINIFTFFSILTSKIFCLQYKSIMIK